MSLSLADNMWNIVYCTLLFGNAMLPLLTHEAGVVKVINHNKLHQRALGSPYIFSSYKYKERPRLRHGGTSTSRSTKYNVARHETYPYIHESRVSTQRASALQLCTCSMCTGMSMESPQENWRAFICTAQILDRGLLFGYGP